VTANYNFLSLKFGVDVELNIQILSEFFFPCWRRNHCPLDYAAEFQFVSCIAHLKEWHCRQRWKQYYSDQLRMYVHTREKKGSKVLGHLATKWSCHELSILL